MADYDFTSRFNRQFWFTALEGGSKSAQPPGAWRPHMAKRPGETDVQHRDRLARSCYRCGWESHDPHALNQHEDAHR